MAAAAFVAGGGSTAAARELPLGDGRASADGPRPGFVFTCGRPAADRPAAARPWIGSRTYDAARKPVVDGGVTWPGARFELRRKASFLGNGHPVRTPTGVFPVAAEDDAYPYDGAGAAVAEHEVSGRLPASPAPRRRRSCVSARKPVAIARNGVPILRALDSAGRDAAAYELHDACGGRTDANGLYFYRAGAPCLDNPPRRRHSGLIGYARDGFGLYGSRGRRGRRLTTRRLDDCHGHRHDVKKGPGVRRAYHYHVTSDYPYTVGCFRSKPSRSWDVVARSPGAAPSPEELPPDPVAQLGIASEPGLYPPFDRSVSDYVTRCVGRQGVRLSVAAPRDSPVAIDGQPPRSGEFSATVPLGPGQAFSFSIDAGGRTTSHHVRCLPEGFPDWSAERPGSPQAEWYLVAPTRGPMHGPWVILFDTTGVPVWWRAVSGTLDATLLPNGNLAWSKFSGGPNAVYEERRLDGTLVRELTTVDTHLDNHEIQQTPDGYLLMSYKPRSGVDLSPWGGPSDATVLDAEIQEVAPDGTRLWVWNSKDHVDLSETGHWYDDYVIDNPAALHEGGDGYDIVHINSAELDGDGVVFSARHLDAVYRVSRATGEVVWKLGGTTRPESLTIQGDPDFAAASFGGQHDARILSDGTLTLFDNGTLRDRAPRALRYELDLNARTATLVEQVTDAGAPRSRCCGGARRLPGGNWVVSWGMNPLVTETSPSGERAFSLSFGGGLFSYRAVPVSPAAVDRAALRAGMDAMNPR